MELPTKYILHDVTLHVPREGGEAHRRFSLREIFLSYANSKTHGLRFAKRSAHGRGERALRSCSPTFCSPEATFGTTRKGGKKKSHCYIRRTVNREEEEEEEEEE